MSDTKNDGNGSGPARETRRFALQKIYVKDLSFEAPKTPGVFIDGEIGEPQIQLNLKNAHSRVSADVCEVILKVSVHATVNDSTLFMAEVEQAGLFLIQGYADEEIRRLLGTWCPSTLFPYIRETVSSLIGKGGFAPMLLQPIDFDTLFAQAMQERPPETMS